MNRTGQVHRRTPELGTSEKRLAAATKQLRIVRAQLDDDNRAALAHVEAALRETEAARHRTE